MEASSSSPELPYLSQLARLYARRVAVAVNTGDLPEAIRLYRLGGRLLATPAEDVSSAAALAVDRMEDYSVAGYFPGVWLSFPGQ